MLHKYDRLLQHYGKHNVTTGVLYRKITTIMGEILDATLTGSDSTIEGVVRQAQYDGFENAYEFVSIDNTLHLTIAKDDEGKWVRVAGTEPFFSGWIDELVEQVKLLRVIK